MMASKRHTSFSSAYTGVHTSAYLHDLQQKITKQEALQDACVHMQRGGLGRPGCCRLPSWHQQL